MTDSTVNSFAVSLLKKVKPDESVVFSPLSLAAALAIVHNGAKGDFQKKIGEVLLKGADQEQVTSYYSSMLSSCTSANGVTMETASKFFVDHSISLLPEYQADIEKLFAASAESHDLSNGQQAADSVNGYVSEKTHGKIKDLVDASSFAGIIAVLVNAVYFKADWKSKFNKERSEEKPFHGLKGERKETLMADGKLKMMYHEEEGVQVGWLPYTDNEYSLVVFLPALGQFQAFRDSLTDQKIRELMQSCGHRTCDVLLPRFKVESDVPATQILQEMGLGDMFSAKADFSGICQQSLCVSEVKHKAVIEVNEEGSEAAAATGIMMMRCSMPMRPDVPPQFHADRPFVYAIAKGMELIFLGQYC